MGNDVKPVYLNLGCGFSKAIDRGVINVDAYASCSPDVVWDLNVVPYPWESNSVDGIQMLHVLEHLENWWEAFVECSRILKPGGLLRIHVPDESSSSALTYRDHVTVFSPYTFHGILESSRGANAWACEVENTVPLKMEYYARIPHKQYYWMVRWCPWLITFCANHLRNFIWEQQLVFRKIGARNG